MNFQIFNSIPYIVDYIYKVMNDHRGFKIVWFGNKRDVFLIDYFLQKYQLEIDCVIDNDLFKTGKELSQVNNYIYYKRYFDWKKRHKIYVHLPGEVVGDSNMIYFVFSQHCEEMKKQLSNYNVPDARIYCCTENDLYNSQLMKCELFNTRLSLKEIQYLELQLLKEFDAYCKREGLKYYLSSGTLLGAVRHKGFIPWDDDIDVYMPYEDYIKFMDGYSSKKYRAVNWQNENDYFFPFGKLVDNETVMVHSGFPVWGIMSVYIDIFPLTGYPPDETIQSFWKRNEDLEAMWNQFYVLNTLGFEGIDDIRNDIIAERYRYSFYNSNMVGAAHIIPGIKQWCVRREIYDNTIDIEFEGENFVAPAGYDEFLKIRYGNYMELPPADKQIAHLFPAYIFS